MTAHGFNSTPYSELNRRIRGPPRLLQKDYGLEGTLATVLKIEEFDIPEINKMIS
ncbi:5924_t:CDS:2 [Racocetra persica]|uniref:5924_t:CDS:1 n=1 Tax=Racocetra persica TaxID=160502 RepID=A0ACA9KTC7_9GLOM|nr:5924_t:CDS:2 [Racocetra persica]